MSKEAGMGPEEGCREANENPRDLCMIICVTPGK
jgi:hypothetical protein